MDDAKQLDSEPVGPAGRPLQSSYLTSLHLPDQPALPSPAQLLTYLIPMPLQPGREVEMMSRVQFPILASFSFSSSIKS